MIMNILNKYLGRGKKKSFYIPINVLADTVNINNSNIIIGNPPFRNKIKRQKHFKRMLKIGKLRFYVTWDFRLKNSNDRTRSEKHVKLVELKHKVWNKTDGHCELCGKKLEKYKKSELHHIMPYFIFKEYEVDETNVLLLCHDCHRDVHTNPFLNATMIARKAKEYNVNLKDYYFGYEDFVKDKGGTERLYRQA